jgi:DNA-binding transcriptional LysR family regulator
VTPGAVSQQMASLELAVGEPLLVRTPSGARPTEVGRRLLVHAEQILAQLDALDHELRDADGAGESASITVASFASATRQLLAPALRELLRAQPGSSPVVIELDPSEAMRAVGSGEVELAVVHGHELRNELVPVGVELTHLYDEPMLLALPSGHPLHAHELDLAELGDERWVLAPDGSACHRVAVRACAAAGFEPRASAQSDDWSTVLALVEAGVGIALVPRGVLDAASVDVELARPSTSVTRAIHLALRRTDRERAIVRQLADLLVERAATVVHAAGV